MTTNITNASELVDYIKGNGSKYTRRYNKLCLEADDNIEEFQEKFEEFRKIVRRLNNYSSNDTTDDKLKDYLSDFADTYNSMKEKREDITDSSLKKQLDKLDTLIDDNEKSLKKLGLKKNDDGELEFDEDTFDDDADQKTINKLFTGTDSFIDQARKLMRKIDYSANDAHVVTVERNVSSTIKYSDEDLGKANVLINVQYSNTLLNRFYENKNNGADYTSNMIDIQTTLGVLAESINYIDNNDKYINLCNDNKVELEKLGFSIGEDASDANKKSLSFVAPASIDADAFDSLFNDNDDSFYSKLSNYCKEDFGKLMKLSTIGLTIDDYTVKIDESV